MDVDAAIEIVDAAIGGWGHINIDQITFSDTPASRLDPVTAQAIANPSNVLVPRPISSRMTSDCASASCRMPMILVMWEEKVERLESRAQKRSRDELEKSDEILKLSEALFAQDIELLRSSEKMPCTWRG
mgnify:CR=1 FL=1